jgi:uncharacterized small protein (DUF1192 family)
VTVTVRLPKAPHLMEVQHLKRTLVHREEDVSIYALQELSRQVASLQQAVERQQDQQELREQALHQLLRDSTSMQVTDGMISRALLRANVEAEERRRIGHTSAEGSWKLQIHVPRSRESKAKPSGKVGYVQVRSTLSWAKLHVRSFRSVSTYTMLCLKTV